VVTADNALITML